MSKKLIIHIIVLTMPIILAACNQPPAVNPWIDDSIPADTWTTPSRDGVLAAQKEIIARDRGYPETIGPHVTHDVAHYPLWWEDPFEDQGDNNDTFAWTWQDYLAMPYGLGRYLLNTMAWPVSAVCTPPCTSMVSDGRLDLKPNGELAHPHDARVGTTFNPTADRVDFGYFEPHEPILITATAPAP